MPLLWTSYRLVSDIGRGVERNQKQMQLDKALSLSLQSVRQMRCALPQAKRQDGE